MKLKRYCRGWGLILLMVMAPTWAQDSIEASPILTGSGDVTAAVMTNEQQRQSLFRQLVEANYRDKVALIKELDQKSGKEMLPVFAAMADGELHYHPDTFQLYRVTTREGVQALFALSPSEKVDPAVLEKVRVNNTLRKVLRQSIARIELMFGEPQQRKMAAETLLKNLNPVSVDLLHQAIAQETDEEIRALLEAGIAMNHIHTVDDSDERVAAVASLAGHLDAPVRQLLNKLVAKDSEGNYLESDIAVRAQAQKTLSAIESKVSLYAKLETLFFGLSMGSVLLLAAIGLAITFGVMGVINMAHGEMIMLGAYTTYVVQLMMPGALEWSILVAIPAAFLVSGCFGVLIERSVIQFLHGRPLETLLATFGISLILQQLVRTIFSPLNRQVATPEWLSGSWVINPVFSLTYNRMAILVFALMLFVALLIIMKKTSLGLYVRAVSQNRDMAKAMGIKTERVDMLTFGLGSGIAGVAGVALSQLTNVGPNLGQSYIIDSFMVVVFGGVGNLLGTLVGAFSLGMANKYLEPAVGAVLANIVILIFIILFIQKRPKGLFPQKGRAAE